jgi:antitoxin component YwqK of YwqJK toxin-antitoxin module
MKYNLLIILFFLKLDLFGQEICRDTNCEIFKDAIEYKDLPKNYSGYCISRFDKKYIFSAKDSLSIVKSKADTTIRWASDILKPFKVDEEKNNFRKGQITQIVLMADGKEVISYSFYDNGKVSMISYVNREHKKFVIYAMNYVFPLIQYYKNGNIKSLASYNLLNERTSVNSYYPDQTLRIKATTKKWKYEGTVITYYPNGKVHKIAMTHENLLEGFLLSYDEQDKLIKTEFFKENIPYQPLDISKYDAQLLILKTLAEEENRNINRKNELIQATKDLVEKEVAKKQKEEELKIQEAEIAKQKLELELLSKNKAISDLTVREKQNEIAKAELLAKQKKQEIENLSKENLIKELSIRNQEAELKKSDAEALINSSKIETLNRENQLKQLEAKKKQEELTKQKMIRNVFIGGFSLLILLVFLVFRSLQQNKKANKIILAQKIEVENQKLVVENQKAEVESAHHHLEEKNREILDSITYAKRIQSAILPQPKLVKEFLEDSFILYKPKDIVAGDFYWLEVVGDTVLFAAADCTGHGVPGAMVSVVCNNGLNRAVREYGLSNPNEILDKTRELSHSRI